MGLVKLINAASYLSISPTYFVYTVEQNSATSLVGIQPRLGRIYSFPAQRLCGHMWAFYPSETRSSVVSVCHLLRSYLQILIVSHW